MFMIYFSQQGHIKLIKSDSKDLYNVTNYFFQVLFFWAFYLSKNPEKMYHSFHKNIKQHNFFHIDNTESFLSTKSAY